MAKKLSLGRGFLELAIEIEKNGARFYESVADRGKSKEVQDIFSGLAAREREHENTFKEMWNRLNSDQTDRTLENYQFVTSFERSSAGSLNLTANAEENYEYIKSVADSNIFTWDKAQAIMRKKTMTDIEAMEAGIALEKDSILFYSDVRGMLPRPDQEIIDAITNEEKKHLSELAYMANKIRSG